MKPYVLSLLSTLLIAAGCVSAPSEDPDDLPPWEGYGLGDAGVERDECGGDEHQCGSTCMPEQPNLPENGCSLGCGDPCPTPEGGTATCTPGGACNFECGDDRTKGEFGCECVPRTCDDVGIQCGTMDDGCGGVLDCGGCGDGVACFSGMCGCSPDDAEPNDVEAAATDLGDFSDRPQTTQTFEVYGLDREHDADWFTLSVDDAFGDGNPDVRVTVNGIPTGAEYEVSVWYVCDSGGDGSSCSAGTADDRVGRGCSARSEGLTSARAEVSASCSGLNESGVALVRVRSMTWMPMCEAYALEIDVD